MKTLKRMIPVAFLLVLILMSVMSVKGQSSRSKATNNYFSTNGPYVSAGPDATCCDNDLFVTQGGFGGEEGLTIWTTSGDGSFNNVYNLNAFYTPGNADAEGGEVILTLTFIFEGGGMIEDEMILHLNNCPGDNEINEL